MRFTFKMAIYLVLATTISTLVAIGGAYQLSVTERIEQASAEAQSQRILAQIEKLVSARETLESDTLSYVVNPSEQGLQRLREMEAKCQTDIAQLARFAADDAAQQRQAAALSAAATTTANLQRQVTRLRQQQGMAAALSFISSESYRGSNREFERLVEAMRQQERASDAARHENIATRTRQLGRLTVWSALMAIALAVFAAAVIHRQREQRRLTEKHLREQEKQYRLVTGSVPAMIGYVDTKHRLRYHNRAVEEWLDLPAGLLDNHHLAEVLGTDTYASILPEIEGALQGKRIEYERKRLGKDGREHYLAGSFIPDFDSAGRTSGFFAMIIDVSERVRQQEEIARINERLDLALQGSRLAIWDIDLCTGRVYLSEGWAEMLGEPARETITDAASMFEMVHPEDRERVRAANVAAVKGASPEYRVEHRVKTHSGAWKWILSHGRVVKRDAAGRALRSTGTNADISARKEIERMKNEFISVVSHELRTPLSSIVGSLGLLAGMKDQSAETQTLIRVAGDNSQRLVRLINDILDLEKLDSDTLKIRLEPVQLETLLATAIQANQGYAQQYGVSLALVQSQGPAWVNANFDKLMQVMANLLSNAAKFSPRGARVEVRGERVGDAFRVSVIDPGPGIAEEFKPRIFDRFAQADSSTSRARGGTGLGLAICKMIIDKLGGKIDFVSAPGAGTTFYFDLPAEPRPERETDEQRGAR